MDDFFSIIDSKEDESGAFAFTIEINKDHDIFNGHFPGKPLVPGVMTLMMIRKCAEQAKGLGRTRVTYVKDAKYIAPIKPDGRKVKIYFNIDDTLNIKADVKSEDGDDFTKVRMTIGKEA